MKFQFKPGHKLTPQAIKAGLDVLNGGGCALVTDVMRYNRIRETLWWKRGPGKPTRSDPLGQMNMGVTMEVYRSGRVLVICDNTDTEMVNLLKAWRSGK